MNMKKENSKNMAILFIICSAFCFSCMNLFVRLSGDLPSVQKSFFRNLVAFFFAVFMIKKDNIEIHITRNSIVPLLIRSIAGTLGILCNFYAVDHLAIADASMLNKLSPFFVVIFSWLILKERIAPFQIGCITVAFLGSLFVIKPTTAIFQNPSSLIGMLGGLAAGLAYAFVRVASQRGVKGPVIVAFFSGFSCLATLPFLISDYVSMTSLQIMTLLLAGLAAAGGQFAITAAYSHAPAREISIYDYSQIIFSTILGFLFLQELPDAYSFLGYFIIIGASLAMFLWNNRKK